MITQATTVCLPGSEQFLSGRFGLYNAYMKSPVDVDRFTAGLGERFYADAVSVKLHPSGRVTHGAADAAIVLRREHSFEPGDIASVLVTYSELGYAMTCQPLAERQVPTKIDHAKFSAFYATACGLVRGRVDLEDFTDAAMADPLIRQIESRTRVEVDPKAGPLLPVSVTVTLADGRQLRREVRALRGSPEDPATWDEYVAKLRHCAEFSARPVASAKLETLVEQVANLERLADVGELVHWVTP